MIFEQTIKHVCSPDPLSIAKERVQTREIAAVIRQRQALVHAALKRGVVPTQPEADGCSRPVSA